MADENKLGTTVTYRDPDQTRQPVYISGIPMMPGEATNLADYMDQGTAEKMAKRLSTNPYFQVEGGPDLQAEMEDRQQRLQEQEQRVAETQRQQLQKARSPSTREQAEAVPTDDQYQAPAEARLAGDQTTVRAPRTAPADANKSNTKK